MRCQFWRALRGGDRELRATNTYYVTVQRLRAKLASSKCAVEIESVRGSGYRLTARTSVREREP